MPDIKVLFDSLEAFRIPPVDQWHPEKIVEIDIRIDASGKWFYQGSGIERHRIAKLFSTVLREEDAQYYLVTPQVKYRIAVDDVPFAAVELTTEGEGVNRILYFRTNMDEVVKVDGGHPVIVNINTDTLEPTPYVVVRDRLRAKIVRSVYYELAELLQPRTESIDGEGILGVYSAGEFFPFGQSEINQ